MFPFDTPSWDAASGAIFPGVGGSLPAICTVIGIAVCIIALAIGNRAEAEKYSKYK